MPENSVKITLEAVDKTQAAFKSLESTSAGITSKLKEHWVGYSAAAIGSILAVKKAFDFGKEIASNLNQIQRQAEMIGLTTTEYQKLSYAAKMSDVSSDALRIGMRGLSMSMGQFVEQAGDGYDVLSALGLSAVDAAGKQKPLNQMLMEIADKFSGYADGAEKVDYANRLMGRSGMELISMLNKGKEGIAGYGEELVKMGGVIDENIIRKGSAAEDTFKNIDVQIRAMKSNLAPAVGLMAELGESVTRYLTPGFEKLGERISSVFGEKGKGMFFKSTDELLEYSKKMAEKPPMPQLVTPPEPDWVKKWVKEFDGLQYSFDQLGVVSEQKLRETADAAIRYVAVIQDAFNKGKASAKDLANAIGAANEAMKKVTGEDPTKKLFDLMVESQKQIDAISKDDPDRQKKVQEIIDRWLEAKKIIQEAAKPTIDLSALKAGFKEGKAAYDAMKEGIESQPIKPKVDMEELNEMRRQNNLPMESTVDFYGTGSSKKPLSEKIQEIIDQFGGMDEALSGMGAMINFTEMTMQFQKLQNQLDQYVAVGQSWQNVTNSIYASINNKVPFKDPRTDQLNSLKEDVMGQMGLLQMKMIMELFDAFGQGGFQTGGIVPRTGFYQLHKGEEVRTTNQVSMSSGPFVFNISGGDARENARQIEKILKYHLSGDLRDAIKNI